MEMSTELQNGLVQSAFSTWMGFTKICVVRGTVSLPGQGDGAGELQLWFWERTSEYGIYASKTPRNDRLVCELLIFFYTCFLMFYAVAIWPVTGHCRSFSVFNTFLYSQ